MHSRVPDNWQERCIRGITVRMKRDRLTHKHGYGVLFTHNRLLKELIESFVNPRLAEKLDFNHLEPLLEKSYIDRNFRDFAEDLVVKVPFENGEAYIYLLIEFQSTVERFLSLRVLNYITLFYLDYLKEHKNAQNLPPVLPIVLYNGSADWTTPDNIRDLIQPVDFLEMYYPDFRYFKIIEKEYSDKELEKVGNAVAGIFYLENTPKRDFEKILNNLDKFLDKETAEIIALLTVWIKHLYRNERIDESIYIEMTNLKNSMEAKSMLVTTLQELREEYIKEGIEQGIAQGSEEKALEDAENLKRLGVSIDIICKATGLDKETVEKL